MKVHLQTIINVCFAISITAFIYQNNLQQKRILTLELDLAVHKAKSGHNFIIPPPPNTETLESCLAKIPTGSSEGIDECWNKHKDD
jgi:hypothetical protein